MSKSHTSKSVETEKIEKLISKIDEMVKLANESSKIQTLRLYDGDSIHVELSSTGKGLFLIIRGRKYDNRIALASMDVFEELYTALSTIKTNAVIYEAVKQSLEKYNTRTKKAKVIDIDELLK